MENTLKCYCFLNTSIVLQKFKNTKELLSDLKKDFQFLLNVFGYKRFILNFGNFIWNANIKVS